MTNDLYIIDPSVADYQALIAALPAGSPWYLLDANRDGLEQILALISDHTDIPALHIISHGSTGTLYLGNTVVNASTVGSYAATLAGIGSHLSASGDILLYGCDVGAGTIGQEFIDRLAALTGADVAASTDLTGAGGDWVLEASSGALEAVGLSSVDYVGTLATLTGGEGNDTITGTTSADTINGRGGNDTINGGDGGDTIDGGEGSDTINGGGGNDSITTGPAQDLLSVDTIYAGAGDDIIDAWQSVKAYGEAGNDNITIRTFSGDPSQYTQEVYGGDGSDLITADSCLIMEGGSGDDFFRTWDLNNSTKIDGGDGVDILEINGDIYKITNWSVLKNFEGMMAGGLLVGVFPDSLANSGITFRVFGGEMQAGDGFFINAINVDFSKETDAYLQIKGGERDSDFIIGGQLSDQIFTTYGDDSVFGEGGSDYIGLGAGVDNATGGHGDDYIDGGDGIDTAIYSGARANYAITEVTYNTFTVQDTVGADGTDTIVDVNKLQFSDQTIDVVIRGLQIIGDGTAEVISGGTEADYIDGAGGDDTLNGLAGNDTLEGGAGADNLSGASGNDFLNGGDGNDQVTGGLGSDTIESGNGDDTVDAGDGNDLIVGGNGAGNDTYRGGTGNDTVKYTSALASITVDLSAASNQATSTAGGDAAGIGTDQLSGIESIIAGNFNDRLTGNAANNRLDGWMGADAMLGLAGNDTYVVDNASDRVYETTTKAGSTDAGGTDTVQSSISLNLGGYTGISFVEKLVLTGSANINGVGNDLANTITGNGGKNTLTGGLGSDSLNGGAGNDILIGGAGNDTLVGGAGLDKFRFNTALGGSNIDTIKGFVTADDTIQLDDAVFAGIGPLGALAANAFVTGTAALDANDRIIFNSATGALLYDADGSGAGAAVQFATISGLTGTVSASDFVII